jgi:hypothetical protein
VAEQADEVGLGAGGQKQRRLFAGQVGGVALKFIDGRVVAIHIVPDRGGHHGFQHGAPGRVTVSLRKSITAFPWSGSTYCFCFT